MSTDEEIEELSAQLLRRRASDAAETIRNAICCATEQHQWDQVIKWNRVKWRVSLNQRCARMARVPALPEVAIGSAVPVP